MCQKVRCRGQSCRTRGTCWSSGMCQDLPCCILLTADEIAPNWKWWLRPMGVRLPAETRRQSNEQHCRQMQEPAFRRFRNQRKLGCNCLCVDRIRQTQWRRSAGLAHRHPSRHHKSQGHTSQRAHALVLRSEPSASGGRASW